MEEAFEFASIFLPFRPILDDIQINIPRFGDGHGLIKALRIVPMIECRQPIHDTLSWRNDLYHAGLSRQMVPITGDFVAKGKRPRWKFNKKISVLVRSAALCFYSSVTSSWAWSPLGRRRVRYSASES